MRLAQAPGVGAVSLRVLELARGEVPSQAEEAKPELAQLEAVFRAAPAATLAESLAALDAAADGLQAIERLFADKLGDPVATPDFRPLTALLGRLRATLAAYGGQAAAAEPAGPADSASGAAEMPPPVGAGGLAARLESREEVVQALELVLDYYRRREPTSPIPLLVERAQRLVPLSFFEVMEDLAPDAMPQLRALAGRAS
jgi:type VI secretion system protein ImpA